MISVLTSSALDHGFKPQSGQTRLLESVFAVSLLKQVALRRKSKQWLLRIRLMCRCGAICQPADCCLSELAL